VKRLPSQRGSANEREMGAIGPNRLAYVSRITPNSFSTRSKGMF
jgi:hypothetical protein